MLRRRTALQLMFAALTAGLAPARAEVESPIPEADDPTPIRAVLELFTSQGCSSCPPADKLLQSFANDPSIIALSMPVDYWDYLGWKDTFASPRNSERQRSYAKARGDGAIYTPQVVVNGAVHVNGGRKSEIDSAIDATTRDSARARVPVRLWQERNTLNIATGVQSSGKAVREATIWLGVVQSAGNVDIKKGENAGETITYTNIVRELTPIGLWKGQPQRIQIPRGAVMLPETQKSVVLIQEGRAGSILGAASTSLY
ncbi:MAG: DUF1223 domain-containing protein [Hyphomicrobium sp.]